MLFWEILSKYYSVIFVITFLVIVILLMCASRKSSKRKSSKTQKTVEIDKLMGNRNSGTPTFYVVDALKTEKITFRGTEERNQ